MPNKQVTNNVELLFYTPNPDEAVAVSARLCYSPFDIKQLKTRVHGKEQLNFIRQLRERGHLSTFEHAVFTFGIEGVSRTLLAQITRHRIASFSVQSQRYVSMSVEDGFSYVLPPAISELGEEAIAEFNAQMNQIQEWYNSWRERLLLKNGGNSEQANEDARFILPGAAATRMTVTMNARELLHFFSLRCCNRAQWEIRDVAFKMLLEVTRVAQGLFENAGPNCLVGECPEGNKSCKEASEVRARCLALRKMAAEHKQTTDQVYPVE